MTPIKTWHAFLGLLIGSWVVELFVGMSIVSWFWGADWQAWYNQPSYAVFFSSITNGRVTPAGIVAFWVWVFFGLHVLCFLVGLFQPLRQRWKLGVRRPSQRERERFESIYQSLVRGAAGPVHKPGRWMIADGLGMQAYWIGYVWVVDRELLHHRFFAPVLAHHLAHANSEDRMARRLYAMFPPVRTLVCSIAGLPLSLGVVALYPLWTWYWRERTFAADRFAVDLGQGHALLTALKELYLKLDQSTKGGRALKPAPYIEQRVDRLEQALLLPAPSQVP